ncbi:GNAT family N-acetyltransferase [Modestobacter muralis]|uniref:GNAT family N-acetyltransferase n=2 Tax=Modestobacter muralis TaxID=1608614 RepID=A0A6P0ER71_9ACTN|nr:GNAT family N-acetyltransferase [Modestobacter muralis]NEN50132.1 GNAT family N-acetyltransferase [Modestobacter muralis]
MIRPAEAADLSATAQAHVLLLPVGLFPSMGERFLRCWHRTFLRLPHGIALVAVDAGAGAGQVVGFLLGTTDQATHTDALLRDRRALMDLGASGLLALLRRPRLAARFARTRGRPWLRKLLQRRGSAVQPPEAHSVGPVAVLAAVAVQDSARGHGLGAALVHHFLAAAQAGGADVAELVTVVPHEGGTSAGFYECLGWCATGDRSTRDGTTVRTYAYPLRRPSRPPARDHVIGREGA